MKEGRFPFHKKAIFAFRQDGKGAEIVLMGMYVHEFVVANSINKPMAGRPPTHHQRYSVVSVLHALLQLWCMLCCSSVVLGLLALLVQKCKY